MTYLAENKVSKNPPQEINASRPVIGHMINIKVTLYFYYASNADRLTKHSKKVNVRGGTVKRPQKSINLSMHLKLTL